MSRLQIPETYTSRPSVQMAPLVDIVFITLIFFMTLSVFYQLETELSINVPHAKQSKETTRTPGEVIINIHRDGQVVVNQRKLSKDEVHKMLKRISSLYPNQPVIIRADKKTYHEAVVNVLDACASARIWNISFATLNDKK